MTEIVISPLEIQTQRRSFDVLRHPRLNKGQAFSQTERDNLKLNGLLPAAVESPEVQVVREMTQLRKKPNALEKYVYLMSLLDRNESLFYRVVVTHITECMPLVYTPTVGQACQEYGNIWSTPRGIYVSIKDKGNVESLLRNWPEDDVKVIVFTDGERILGLGDLGVNGMGIPVGKLQLYACCAGIPAHQCLPVQIDVGTNNPKYLDDPLYLGLKQNRVRGEEFMNLIEEFLVAVQKRWNKSVLVQFEDFGNTTAFDLLEKFRNRFTTFNDDIQGTAAVSLAGIIASLPVTSKNGGAQKLSDHVYVFLGAGEAGVGIAQLIAYAIQAQSQALGIALTLEEARKKIWLVDSKGLVTKSRAEAGGLAHHKLDFAHEYAKELTDLTEIVFELKATSLIGVSAQPNTFTKPVCQQMSKNCLNPLIFALSNPTSKAECTASQAYEWTDGHCIFASGSPFDPVELTLSNGEKKRFLPGQGNNAYIFPGLGLGILTAGASSIPDELLYVSAKALAEAVTEQDLANGSMYPPLVKIRQVSLKIAAAVAERTYELGLATVLPKPSNFVEACIHNTVQPVYRQVSAL